MKTVYFLVSLILTALLVFIPEAPKYSWIFGVFLNILSLFMIFRPSTSQEEFSEYLKKLKVADDANDKQTKEIKDHILGHNEEQLSQIKELLNSKADDIKRAVVDGPQDAKISGKKGALPSSLNVTTIEKSGIFAPEHIKACKNLLDAFRPPSLISIFPDTHPKVLQAIQELQNVSRLVTLDRHFDSSDQTIALVDMVSTGDFQKVILEAPGGSGKTHILWNLAERLLIEGQKFPVYISLVDFSSTSQVVKYVEGIYQKTIADIASHPNVVFFLDGWSQFETSKSGNLYGEQRKLLGILGNSKIIASTRYITKNDSAFLPLFLSKLSIKDVEHVIATAFGKQNMPSDEVMDFLKSPLPLLLYLLMGGSASSTGSLLDEFHRRLSENFPQQTMFLEVLSKVCADTSLIKPSKNRSCFESAIRHYSKEYSFPDFEDYLEQLGTIDFSTHNLVPIHDLYWEWLLGIGVLSNWQKYADYVVRDLQSDTYLILALESGAVWDPRCFDEIANVDLIQASKLLPLLNDNSYKDIIADVLIRISSFLVSDSVSKRISGIISACYAQNSSIFTEALSAFSTLMEELTLHKDDVEEIFSALRGVDFGIHKAALCDWLPHNGKAEYYLFEAIALSKDEHLIGWLLDAHGKGKIKRVTLVRCILPMLDSIPNWMALHIKELAKNNQLHIFKTCDLDPTNRELARIAIDLYKELVNDTASPWYHLNSVLITCADEDLIREICLNFSNYHPVMQETILFALKEIDIKWIQLLQVTLLPKHFHKGLRKIFDVPPSVDESIIIESWIGASHRDIQILGWKAYILKHKKQSLTRVFEEMPTSFENVHFLPQLIALASIDELPRQYLDELWSRLRGEIQPRLMYDWLHAVSKCSLGGVPSVINQLKYSTNFLPNYHLAIFLRLYKEWQEKQGFSVRVRVDDKEAEISDYLVIRAMLNDASEDATFLKRLVAENISTATLDQLVYLWNPGESSMYEIYNEITEIPFIHRPLIGKLMVEIGNEAIPSIIKKFKGNISSLPAKNIIDFIQKICLLDNHQDVLCDFISVLAQKTNDKNADVYFALIPHVLKLPQNKIRAYANLGNLLASLPEKDVIKALQPYFPSIEDSSGLVVWYWQRARGLRYLDESGRWLIKKEMGATCTP